MVSKFSNFPDELSENLNEVKYYYVHLVGTGDAFLSQLRRICTETNSLEYVAIATLTILLQRARDNKAFNPILKVSSTQILGVFFENQDLMAPINLTNNSHYILQNHFPGPFSIHSVTYTSIFVFNHENKT